MELTRRDALAALATTGAAVGAGSALGWETLRDEPANDANERTGSSAERSNTAESVAFAEREVATLTVLAGTLYPSAVTGIPAFVETYVVGRVRDRPEYAEGVRAALATLDDYATDWFDGAYTTLQPANREALLRQMGLDTAAPDPAGSDRERLRYYLLNELLYALYSSPTGGTLAGIENPRGHPGGLASYQRGPSRK
jgi:hypothetical protein